MHQQCHHKLKTRLHDVFHPVIKFHITGWKTSMRVNVKQKAFCNGLFYLPLTVVSQL